MSCQVTFASEIVASVTAKGKTYPAQLTVVLRDQVLDETWSVNEVLSRIPRIDRSGAGCKMKIAKYPDNGWQNADASKWVRIEEHSVTTFS